eukprot:TRINITY_DN25371_c0_g1_i2.p1 TRINITY_DN25371_c0_g1~~TRINITY_DN25371_c0_g1_i2.p1  ORF type:complete len:299 (-),score=71.58 TRINITY_DN25371_c0_g1_i2:324-1220(-)
MQILCLALLIAPTLQHVAMLDTDLVEADTFGSGLFGVAAKGGFKVNLVALAREELGEATSDCPYDIDKYPYTCFLAAMSAKIREEVADGNVLIAKQLFGSKRSDVKCLENVSNTLSDLGEPEDAWGFDDVYDRLCDRINTTRKNETSSDCCNTEGERCPISACWSGFRSETDSSRKSGWVKKLTDIAYQVGDTEYNHEVMFSLDFISLKSSLCVQLERDGKKTERCFSEQKCSFDMDPPEEWDQCNDKGTRDVVVHSINGKNVNRAKKAYDVKCEADTSFWTALTEKMGRLVTMACAA